MKVLHLFQTIEVSWFVLQQCYTTWCYAQRSLSFNVNISVSAENAINTDIVHVKVHIQYLQIKVISKTKHPKTEIFVIRFSKRATLRLFQNSILYTQYAFRSIADLPQALSLPITTLKEAGSKR